MAIEIGAPQIIYIGLTALGLGFAIAKHGQPREPYSTWTQLIATVISFSLLWWGGFFGG